MTYSGLFHYLYYARRALQALAALSGDDTCCDLACEIDALASVVWRRLLTAMLR